MQWLLNYCFNTRPLSIVNLDLMYDKKLKKKIMHGLHAQYYLSYLFHR